MFYTYFIKSIHFDFAYIGQNSDLTDRILRHNQGRSKSTKPYRPFRLIAAIALESRKDAVALELKLKHMKNPDKVLQYLRDHFPDSIIEK